MRPLIVDLFAGGGGASEGIRRALGRGPDYAINHSSAALALHAANHPETKHINANVWDVDPRALTAGRPVGLLWASPDCKHFSKAKGAAVRDRNTRDLAWVVTRWAEEARPQVICVENVEEFTTWGPVGEDGQPIKEFAGITFEAWVKRFRAARYTLKWTELRGYHYGAPTLRKRWFLVARCDGRRILWPVPTHRDPSTTTRRRTVRPIDARLRALGGSRPPQPPRSAAPWRTAAECIDWSIPLPSIFATAEEIMAQHGVRAVRPLTRNTLVRVARGAMRYVLQGNPFMVSLKGSDRRDSSITAPHPTVLAGGGHSAIVAPMVAYAQQGGGTRAADQPMHTICASRKDQNQILAAFLAQNNNHGGKDPSSGRPIDAPMSTIVSTWSAQSLAAAWVAKWYSTPQAPDIREPMHTITTKARFDVETATLAAPPFRPEHEARARQVADFLREFGGWESTAEYVTVDVDGITYVIVDLGIRMFTPRELYRAQGFPDTYQIEGAWMPDETGTPKWHAFSKATQISCVGNSVCPDVAAALVAANCQHLADVSIITAAE